MSPEFVGHTFLVHDGRKHINVYVTEDVAHDERWALWGQRVSAEIGLRSVLAYRLNLLDDSGAIAALNVYSAEVERVIGTVPGVMACAVIGVPDPKWGETVAAYVSTDASVTPDEVNLVIAAIEEACGRALARYKHPARIQIVDDLPRNELPVLLRFL